MNALRVLLILFLSFSMFIGFSQEDEEEDVCTKELDKKVVKILEKAKEEKDEIKKTDLYVKALDLDDECTQCMYDYATFLYKRGNTLAAQAKREYTSYFSRAIIQYQDLVDLCPEYHAEVYYNLGRSYFETDRKDAAFNTFDKYMNFQSDDNRKFERKYDERVAELQISLPRARFKYEFYSNLKPYNAVPVENVSQEGNEYMPMISPDNELLFFTRFKNTSDMGSIKENWKDVFMVSVRPDVTTYFDGGIDMDAPFNKEDFSNYGGVTISVNNREMIICACKVETVKGIDYNNCDLYSTTYMRSGEGGNDYEWTELISLGENINTPDGWEAQPTLSADGNTLYFATIRAETQGGADIYVSERGADGIWSVARPINGPINTLGDDKSPFLHQDSETLYFVSECSDERWGAGGLDIFYSRKDSLGNWQEPVNIGYPINDHNDEIGLMVSTDGRLAYFATNRFEGKGGYDVYYFELYPEARPKAVQLLKGIIIDDKGNPAKNAKIEINYSNGEKQVVDVPGNDGTYAVIVNKDKADLATITVKQDGYTNDFKFVDTDSEETFVKEVAMVVNEIQIGQPYTIKDILYATGSFDLSDQSKAILDEFAKFLIENASIKIEIQGHTDNRGNRQNNISLSEKRAKSVMDYLITLGIAAERLAYKGYGPDNPKESNDTEAGRKQNRRTDFVITEK